MIEAGDPNVFVLAGDDGAQQDRFLARTTYMRWPDTINVQYVDLGDGRSTLAILSRSQIGRSDFGVNEARVRDWIGRLRTALPLAQP